MISTTTHAVLRRAAVTLALLGVLAACHKNDAPAGQVGGKLNDAAQAAAQKLDQAASYIGQQVDATRSAAQQKLNSAASGASAVSITIVPDQLASSAQANFQGAASATGAALNRAASMTGEGLQAAGRQLQQWSGQNTEASAAAAASN